MAERRLLELKLKEKRLREEKEAREKAYLLKMKNQMEIQIEK